MEYDGDYVLISRYELSRLASTKSMTRGSFDYTSLQQNPMGRELWARMEHANRLLRNAVFTDVKPLTQGVLQVGSLQADMYDRVSYRAAPTQKVTMLLSQPFPVASVEFSADKQALRPFDMIQVTINTVTKAEGNGNADGNSGTDNDEGLGGVPA